MKNSSLGMRNPTVQRFLTVLRSQHRQQCRCDPEADPKMRLTLETTIAQWRTACDLMGWRQLATSLNEFWQTEISLERWKIALEPAEKRRLRDVCELLARECGQHAAQPEPLILKLPPPPSLTGQHPMRKAA